ncbi:MAG TPA: hypothetical protein VFV50_17545, partial [Bdellovibrionales bacterium]|nr:hypothetical protein [Bdellovibrionales bacterium]
MLRLTKTAFFSLLLVYAAAGCAQRDSKGTPDVRVKMGPRLTDAALKLDGLEGALKRVLDRRSNEIPTASLFECAADYIQLGKASGRREIQVAGHDLLRKYYADSSHYSQILPRENLYLDAALGEKWQLLQGLLTKNERDVVLSSRAVERAIVEVPLELGNPDHLTVTALGQRLIGYLHRLADEFRVRGASEKVVNEYTKTLRETFGAPLDRLLAELTRLDGEIGLLEALGAVERIQSTLKELKLGTVQTQGDLKLAEARKLGSKIKGIKTSSDALAVIIDVWLMLTPQQRENVFKTENPDLYEYFVTLKDSELRTLQTGPSRVWNPMLYIAREKKIIPALERYGVEKLKRALDVSSAGFVRSELKDVFVKLAGSVPKAVGELVLKSLKDVDARLKAIRANEKSYFTDKAVAWGKREILTAGDYIAAVESQKVVLNVDGGTWTLSPARLRSTDSLTTATMGAAFRASVMRWNDLEQIEGTSYSSPEFLRLVLMQMNRLLGIGGFREHTKELFKSYHFPFTLAPGEILDLRRVDEFAGRYAVPDRLVIERGLKIDRERTVALQPRFSAGSQAKLLSGVSMLATYFRDWVKNGFDRKMGEFVLGDFDPEFTGEIARERLFPKEKFLELSLGVGSVVLKNLTGPNSGLALLYPDGRVAFGDQLDSIVAQLKTNPGDGVPMMAATVDVDASGPDAVARAGDTAALMLAIADFSEALEGLEQSKSALLSDPKFQAEVKASRTKLNLLMMVLANFLSGSLQGEDGLFRSSRNLWTGQYGPRAPISEQLLAIRALLAASKALGAELYRWAAVDAYFGMNRQLWSAQGFYADGAEPLAPHDLVALALTLQALQPLVPDESRPQLEKVLTAV